MEGIGSEGYAGDLGGSGDGCGDDPSSPARHGVTGGGPLGVLNEGDGVAVVPELIEDGDRVFWWGQWLKVRGTTAVQDQVYLHLAGLPSILLGTTERVFVIRRRVWESRVLNHQ